MRVSPSGLEAVIKIVKARVAANPQNIRLSMFNQHLPH